MPACCVMNILFLLSFKKIILTGVESAADSDAIIAIYVFGEYFTKYTDFLIINDCETITMTLQA